MAERISRQALKALMESRESYALFDVREQGEFSAGQISTATSLPRGQIEFRLAELVPVLDIPVILYDESGERAPLAATTIERLGYQKVYVLEGGLPAWVTAGYPTATGLNVPSKEFGERVHVEREVSEITPEEVCARRTGLDNFVILDARTPDEYQRFCIPGGLNVPGGDLVLWAEDLRRKLNTTVVVNCAGRTRSVIGTETLRRLGLSNVYALRNGTMGWVLAGLELEKSPARDTPSPSSSSRAAAEVLATRIGAEEGIPLISVSELRSLRSQVDRQVIYPVPQKAPCVSAGMNVPDSLRGQRPKATGVSPWYGVYLIDVRSGSEYAAGHIPGFVWIPGGQAVQRADDYIAVRNAKIVFACDGQARAIMAAYWFRHMGFENVAVLEGGLRSWVNSGQALVTGIPLEQVEAVERARRFVRFTSCDELARLIEATGPVILDVGTSREFEAGHVPGARWISRGWLESKINELCPDPREPIVVTCPTGQHSTLAAWTLSELGYTEVSVLEGGVRAWNRQSRPSVGGLEGCVVEPNDVVLSASIKGDKEAMARYLEWEIGLGRKYKG